MLETGSDLLVGHNLDESPGLHVPGLVCVNMRNTYREGISWSELIEDPAEYERALVPFAEKPFPKLSWRSRFGSITFNSEGLDFPDGGVNEAGLAIFEMSLGATQHKFDALHPTLFIALWIQYQLDRCATVEEVIRNAHDINQDGWSWHYFVTDGDGNCAIIEYLRGEVVVHAGDDVRYPVLCNAEYSKELTRLDAYHGVGATLRSWLGKTPRFVRAARMLDAYESTTRTSARDHALDTLKSIQIRGWNKWAILVDVKSMAVYFHTNLNRKLRQVSFADFDFNPGPALLLDIHANLAGDVTAAFEPYTYERNLSHCEERAEVLFEERFRGFADRGLTARMYATRFADYSMRMRSGTRETGRLLDGE
jgi:choloylglycine hydrolase